MAPAPRRLLSRLPLALVALLLVIAAASVAVAGASTFAGQALHHHQSHRGGRIIQQTPTHAAAALLPPQQQRLGRTQRQRLPPLAMAASNPLAALRSLASAYSSWLVGACVVDAMRGSSVFHDVAVCGWKGYCLPRSMPLDL